MGHTVVYDCDCLCVIWGSSTNFPPFHPSFPAAFLGTRCIVTTASLLSHARQSLSERGERDERTERGEGPKIEDQDQLPIMKGKRQVVIKILFRSESKSTAKEGQVQSIRRFAHSLSLLTPEGKLSQKLKRRHHRVRIILMIERVEAANE